MASKTLAGLGATGNLMIKQSAPREQTSPRPGPVHAADRPLGHPAYSPTTGAPGQAPAPPAKALPPRK